MAPDTLDDMRAAHIAGAIILLTALAVLPAPTHAASPLERNAGPHGVGFRVETRLDRARPFRPLVDPADDAHARPIRMFIWYPAAAGAPGGATVADYARESESSATRVPTDATLREAVAARMQREGADEEDLDAAVGRLLETPVRARWDAAPAEGSFPLVVIAPGGTTPGHMHALLGEHLASHGYVCVAVPSLPMHEGERWPFDQTGVALHVRDMEAALDHLLASPSVDRARVALAGWSVGGVAQALMEMRNPDVGALVSIDGATGYAYGLSMLRAAIDYDTAGVSVPYFHAHGLAPARFEVEKNFTVFDSLATGPAVLLTFPDLGHADFASLALLERRAVDPEGSARSVEAYGVLLEAVRRFLDASFEDPGDVAGVMERWLATPGVRGLVTGGTRGPRSKSSR